DELQLRGSDAGAPCVLVRRGARSRFAGTAFRAVDEVDVLRLADATGAPTKPLPESLGGICVDLVDPSGLPVPVAGGMHELPELAHQRPHVFNVGHQLNRTNATQRPPRMSARI